MEARFLLNTIKRDNGCVEWTGSKHRDGYGKLKVLGRTYSAHRYAYTLFKGEIPAGNMIRHKCDNRLCVNIEHLETGTHRDNMNDRNERNRTAKGDRTGARLHPELLSRGDNHYSRTRPELLARGNNHLNSFFFIEKK
jgi:hypothetical protein